MKFKKSFSSLMMIALFSFITGCKQQPNVNQSQNNSEVPNDSYTLKVGTSAETTNIDPRLVRDLSSTTTLRLLFEGLVKHDSSGKIILALADKIDTSPDMTVYTFHLKNSSWSNGEPLTAHDFEYSWKSLLAPEFPAPNAYQFFVIKGAKAAKDGKDSLDNVGIKALNDQTLQITLNYPVPYFLQLIAFHPFFPVKKKWDQSNTLAKNNPQNLINNGPFLLKTWAPHNAMVFTKNAHFWDKAALKIDEVQLLFLEEHTALQMFENGDLDWAGSPLSTIPADAVPSLRKSNALKITSAAGTHWFRLNTEKAPFNNIKIRQAFSYVIDRHALTEHILQGGQTPAMGIVPHGMNFQDKPYFKDHDIAKGQQLFYEALTELNIDKEQFPEVVLSYTQSDRNHKIAQAVQQQWNTAFGIKVKLESFESKAFFDKLGRQDYQMSIGSWFADINDPINFLEVFKYKANTTNNTLWENSEYTKLLDASSDEPDSVKRSLILKEAEGLLMEQMPIIPLYYASFNYVKKDQLQGVIFSDLGYLDFTHAFLESEEGEKE